MRVISTVAEEKKGLILDCGVQRGEVVVAPVGPTQSVMDKSSTIVTFRTTEVEC